MSKKFPPKDPDEVLDYVVDWSERLGTDTITESTWVVEGVTKDSDSHASTSTTIWLSGGTLGESYSLLNRIVTAGGRTMDQTVTIAIKAK